MNDWIEWNGGKCPVADGTIVDLKFRDGEEVRSANPDVWCWSHLSDDVSNQVVAYRVVKEVDMTTSEATIDIAQILTERGERYGKFTEHSDISQKLKAVIRSHLEKRQKVLAHDQQEALEMFCHKMARIVNGDPDYADSWLDIAGYAKLVADRLQGMAR